MRIKLVRTPPMRELDGIKLQHFVVGQRYDVGSRLGALMLAEGWAEPLSEDEPALLMPLFDGNVNDPTQPANLVREKHPPSIADETAPVVADFERRRRRRR